MKFTRSEANRFNYPAFLSTGLTHSDTIEVVLRSIKNHDQCIAELKSAIE